jgi:hypothetical protein
MILAAACGWVFRGAVADSPQDRPVMRAIFRFAKTAGWLFLVAEPPPETSGPEAQYQTNLLMGSDGYPLVDHRSAM